MIKGVAYTDTSKVLMLGISERNVENLQDGRPMKFDLAELGLPEIEMIIFYGETEEAMARDVAKLAKSNESVQIIDRRPKPRK